MRRRFMDEEFILRTLAYYYVDNFNKSPYTGKLIDEVVALKTRKELDQDFEHIFGLLQYIEQGFV